MRKETQHSAPALAPEAVRGPASLELDGGLAELRTDCAQMVPHWSRPAPAAEVPVPDARILGLARIMVPPASADLLRGMSEYGD